MFHDTENSAHVEPQYVTIKRTISAAISSGDLPPGAVLIEGPIAEIFGTSRTPVRTAFGELMQQGSLRRFEGRGFVVSGAQTPRRIDVTPELFGILAEKAGEPRIGAALRIAEDLENVLTRALPFGLWRINEKALAEHYDVSRTVVRELLPRFQDRGILRKDRKSHWLVGPLTSRDIANYFAVRSKLEPLALIESGPLFPPEEIDAMWQRTMSAVSNQRGLSPERLESMETDIHIKLLSKCDNPHLLRMINQSQIALVVNRLFADVVGVNSFEMSLREHLIVLEFAMRGAWETAGRSLEEHLKLSAARTRQRLKAISVFPGDQDLPPYLIRQAQ